MTIIENEAELLTNSTNTPTIMNNPFDMNVDRPINIGIDKIRIGFNLIPPYFRDEESLLPQQGGRGASWPITEHTNLYLFTNRVKGVQRGYITFNPARVYDPHGTSCATWDQTLVAIGESAQIAYNQFFIFRPGLDQLDLYGMHLTADFSPIPDMQRVLEQAKKLRVFGGRKPKVHFSLGGESIETVYFNSSSRGQLKFYDKTAQANLNTTVLRIEYETKRSLHRKDGTRKVFQVTEETIDRLFKSRLEPVIRALRPCHTKRVDEILQDPSDTKTLISICGREFLKHHGIYPQIGSSYKARKSKFDKKYPYSNIEDIL